MTIPYDILLEAFKILFETNVDILCLPVLEHFPYWIQELHDASHKFFAIGLVLFDFLESSYSSTEYLPEMVCLSTLMISMI